MQPPSSPQPQPAPDAASSIPSDSTVNATTTGKLALARLQGLLRRVLRVAVEDRRVFLGTFAGTDKALNVLLINTEEYKLGVDEVWDGRFVGQVMIPWRTVKKIEAQSQDSTSFADAGYI